MDSTTTKSIAEALGLESLEPNERVEILNDIYDLINKGTLVRLLEKMNDSQKTEFDELLAREAPEGEMAAFLEKIPEAEEAVKETIAELERDILAVTA